MYEGAIIKETLADELFLDHIVIDKAEVWKTKSSIKYWTMIFFHSEVEDLPRLLTKTIKKGWFADIKSCNTKYVIFNNKILKYEIGNSLETEEVISYMRSIGIPEQQINGSINWNP